MEAPSRGGRHIWFDRLRTGLFWLHFAAGVVAALVVVVMALAGATMAFEANIVDAVESGTVVAPPEGAGAPLPPSTLLDALKSKLPPNAFVTGLTTRADPHAPALVTTKDGTSWLVDPYRGEVLGKSRVRAVFGAVEDVHRTLGFAFVGKSPIGKTVTGWTAALVALLALSGPLLWWPRRRADGERRFRRIAFFVRNASSVARDFNWHNVIGIWTAPLLLVIAVTGTCISIDGVKQFVQRTFGATRPVAEAPPPSPSFDLDTAWSEAAKRVPHWSTINGRWPAREGKFTLRIRTAEGTRPNEWNQLTYDANTGGVTSFSQYETAKAGTRILGWARWMHTGQAFGLVGQILAALTALGTAVLGWTGLALAFRRARRSLRRRRES